MGKKTGPIVHLRDGWAYWVDSGRYRCLNWLLVFVTIVGTRVSTAGLKRMLTVTADVGVASQYP